MAKAFVEILNDPKALRDKAVSLGFTLGDIQLLLIHHQRGRLSADQVVEEATRILDKAGYKVKGDGDGPL